jgi:NADPH-ferrihemoprotein reductase
MSKTPLPNNPESFIDGVTSNYLRALQAVQHTSSTQRGEFSGCPTYDIPGVNNSFNSEIKLYAQIRPSKFKLPARATTPIIMVAAGTGIAPFRAFVADRARFANMGRPVGEMLLFFGCRRPDEDSIYREKFEDVWAGLDGKGLFSIVPAFSRVDDGVYVQDMVKREAKDVVRLLEEGANLYICGSEDGERGGKGGV